MKTREENERAAREYIESLVPVMQLVRLIDVDAIRGIVEEYERSHSWLPVVDPTAYRNMLYDPNTDCNVKAIRAFLAYRKALDEIAEGVCR